MRRLLLSICCCVCFAASAQEENRDLTLNQVIGKLTDRLQISGFMQFGYDYDDAPDTGQSSFYHKRASFSIRGFITDRWTAFFAYEYSNSTSQEIYTEYKFADELSVRMGQFKTVFGLENGIIPTQIELIDDYAMGTAYLMANRGDVLQGNHAGRDIGLLVSGDLFKKILHYDFSVMNGQGFNRRDGNRHKDLVGRITVNPTPWLSVSASYYDGMGHAIATNNTLNIYEGDDYTRNRWAMGATVSTDFIKLRTEYLGGKDGSHKSEGWYATGVVPLSKSNNLELLISYDYFNKSKTLDLKQTNYTGGLQWWFYPGCRLRGTYSYRDVKQSDSSNVLQAQVQVTF